MRRPATDYRRRPRRHVPEPAPERPTPAPLPLTAPPGYALVRTRDGGPASFSMGGFHYRFRAGEALALPSAVARKLLEDGRFETISPQ